MTEKVCKVTAKEFERFKSVFKKYQEEFGLQGYKVYFKLEKLDTCFANITVEQEDMVATVRLANQVEGFDAEVFIPDEHAKHEALHLLVTRLADLARSRFVTKSDVYEAEEELVRRITFIMERCGA